MLNIFYCFDENYEIPGIVSLISLLENNKNYIENFQVTIINEKTSKNYLLAIKKIENKYKINIQILYYSNLLKEFSLVRIPEHNLKYVSRVAWVRLFIPLIVKKNPERSIYLDADTIVLSSINELEKININQSLVGAVPDPSNIYMLKRHSYFNLKDYFNSGIILFNHDNLSKIKYYENLSKVLNFYSKLLLYGDQCALNILFKDQIFKLDSIYNTFIASDELHNIFENTDKFKIIHFIGYRKPWHINFNHPLGKKYHQYLSLIPN